MILLLITFLLVIFFLPISQQGLDALIVGSNTVPSRQTAAEFPTANNNNTLLGFADFAFGFTLANNTVTCTFNDFFTVGGFVCLRGGQLWLQKDLIFDKSLVISSSGFIFAASNSITFPKTIPDFNMNGTLTFDTAMLVFVDNATITAPLQFRNGCRINAMGNRLTFKSVGGFSVRPGGSLIIENAELWGVKARNVNCMTDRGALTLRNSTLVLAQDYTFSNGSILFSDDVVITGTNRFIYGSGLTSTIASFSTLFLDYGITFSYAPRNVYSTLIGMTDNTSYLYLNGCTLFSTRTGLQLSTGTLLVDDMVTFSSQGRARTEALHFNTNLTVRVKGRGTANLQGLILYG